jgi:hypothetical protein
MALLKDEIALINMISLPKDLCIVILGYSRKDWRSTYSCMVTTIPLLIACEGVPGWGGCDGLGITGDPFLIPQLLPMRRAFGPGYPLCRVCQDIWLEVIQPSLSFMPQIPMSWPEDAVIAFWDNNLKIVGISYHNMTRAMRKYDAKRDHFRSRRVPIGMRR